LRRRHKHRHHHGSHPGSHPGSHHGGGSPLATLSAGGAEALLTQPGATAGGAEALLTQPGATAGGAEALLTQPGATAAEGTGASAAEGTSQPRALSGGAPGGALSSGPSLGSSSPGGGSSSASGGGSSSASGSESESESEEEGGGAAAGAGGKDKKRHVHEARAALIKGTPGLEACFEGIGWSSEAQAFVAEPEWSEALRRLEAHLARLGEAGRRARSQEMLVGLGTPQACVAVSARHRLVFAGGKDSVIRAWDPFITDPVRKVSRLEGHAGRIVALCALDRHHLLLSAAVDKWVRVWDVRTQAAVAKVQEPFTFVPVDRLMCVAFDPASKLFVTWGNRARVWTLRERRPEAGAGRASPRHEAVAAAKQRAERAREAEAQKRAEAADEALAETGWTVVDPAAEAARLEARFGDGRVWRLPDLDPLSGKSKVPPVSREAVEDGKWLQLHEELEQVRLRGCGQPLAAGCYSRLFQQLIMVGAKTCFVVEMRSGKTVTRFEVGRRGVPVTAATLDHSERRLFTGAHDGSVPPSPPCSSPKPHTLSAI
jgi:hypothetical protein